MCNIHIRRASVRLSQTLFFLGGYTGHKMPKIGGNLSWVLVAAVVLSVAGTAAATVYYQSQIEESQGSAEERKDRIEALERRLNDTEHNLSDARAELQELRGIEQEVEGLEARNEELSDLVTGKVDSAVEAERRRQAAAENLTEARNRLGNLSEDYGDLLREYEKIYKDCRNSDGCSVSAREKPSNYTSYGSSDGF